MQARHCFIICWIASSASCMRPNIFRLPFGLTASITHTGHGNFEKLRVRGQEGGWNIVFEQQPANSPDFNKLDLSFFYSLQQAATKLRGASISLED